MGGYMNLLFDLALHWKIYSFHTSKQFVLKVAFFRKYDSFFKIYKSQKKNIPKNYPELEI